MPTLDPFTQAYQAIRDALRVWSGWSSLVKLGNFVDFSATPFRAKNNISAADVPEVALIPTTFAMSPFGPNSKTAGMSQSFQIVTTTDRLNVIPLNAVKYHTLIALLKAGEGLGIPALVRDWNITAAQDGSGGIVLPGAGDSERHKIGFGSILTIDVQMYQSRAELLAL